MMTGTNKAHTDVNEKKKKKRKKLNNKCNDNETKQDKRCTVINMIIILICTL